MKTKKTVTSPQAPNLEGIAAEIMDLKNRLARALADYQNLEKRYERESSAVVKFANASVLAKLLDIRDHLNSASAHLKDPSLSMILSSIDKLLADEGAVMVDTSGEFDPNTMECQETVPGESNKVISVARPGYRLHDRLLRPARVTVGSGTGTQKV